MTPAEAPAMGFEAVKVSMSQTKDGVKLVLVLHPHEDTSELFNHPVGSRYQMALVLLDDQEQPVPRSPLGEGERAVRASGILCKEPRFQKWLIDGGYCLEENEKAAINAVHLLCGVNSRAELKENKEALSKFNSLRLRYSSTIKD